MSPVTLTEMGPGEVDDYRSGALARLKSAVSAGSSPLHARAERKIISELALHVFRSVPVFAVSSADGEQVGVLAAAFNKRPAGDWGRYVNAYIVHTRMEHRGSGYAVAAYKAVAAEGVTRGCSRLTTAAATLGGWRVHRALGWPAWGLNVARQIVTDADIAGTGRPGLPARCARLTGPGRPLAPAEHAAALTDPAGPYRVDPATLAAPYELAGR